MVLLDFSMTPLGKGECVRPYVARCLEVVAASGLDYHHLPVAPLQPTRPGRNSGASKVPPCCTIPYNTSATRRHRRTRRKLG